MGSENLQQLSMEEQVVDALMSIFETSSSLWLSLPVLEGVMIFSLVERE